METEFEVITNLKEVHQVEFYRYIWRKRMWTIGISVSIGVLCLFAQYFLEDFPGWLYFLWLVGYSVWLYFRPWMAARKVMKQELKFEGTEELLSVTKFADSIYDESKHQNAVIPYDKVEKIHLSKHIIVLTDVRKMAIILDKNGFTKGTIEEFIPFIQKKCPQLKLPKW